MPVHKRERGTALITALLIVSIVATLYTVMIMQRRVDINRTELLFRQQQANLDADLMLYQAENYLVMSLKKHLTNKTAELFPVKLKTLKLNNGYGKTTIIDMQGRFNINSLIDIKNIAGLKLLLVIVDPKISTDQANVISNALHNWFINSGSSEVYENYHPPYVAAHTPMVSRSEFRLLQGVSSNLYSHLLPYICALPFHVAININSASAAVLSTLGIPFNISKQIVAYRKQHKGFRSLLVFNNFPLVSRLMVVKSVHLTLYSQYFLVQTTIKSGREYIYNEALVRRWRNKGNKKHINIAIIWRHRGDVI